jgi:hypothetical protein
MDEICCFDDTIKNKSILMAVDSRPALLGGETKLDMNITATRPEKSRDLVQEPTVQI